MQSNIKENDDDFESLDAFDKGKFLCTLQSLAPSEAAFSVNKMAVSSRDAPILILISVLANNGHIFKIGTAAKSSTLTNLILALILLMESATSALIISNIGILVKVSLANQFHKSMYLLFYTVYMS